MIYEFNLLVDRNIHDIDGIECDLPELVRDQYSDDGGPMVEIEAVTIADWQIGVSEFYDDGLPRVEGVANFLDK